MSGFYIHKNLPLPLFTKEGKFPLCQRGIKGDFVNPLLIFSVLVILLLIGNRVGYAESDGWEANLIVSISNADSRLSFGQKADASDRIDGMYDVPAMLGGDLMAYFICGGAPYWSDIKGYGKGFWHLRIESTLKGEPVIVKWNPGALPADRKVILIDTATEIPMDMKAGNQYIYQNTGSRDLKIGVMP